MQNYFILLLFLSLNALHFGHAQNYSVFSIPDSIARGADAVIREHSVNITVKSQDNIEKNEHYVITVMNKNAISLLQFVQMYNSYIDIKSLSGSVYDIAGNKTYSFKNKHFKDKSAISSFSIYEDIRVKTYEPGVSTFPFTVEYTVSTKQSGFFSSLRWSPYRYFRHSVGVERASFSISLKDTSSYRYKAVNIENSPDITEHRRHTEFRWSFDSLLPFENEMFSLPIEDRIPFIMIAPNEFSVDGYKGDMSSWKTMGAWQMSLMHDKQSLPAQTISEIQALIEPIADTTEMVKRIYEYMQSKTRYVSIQIGIGGWQPFSAEHTDKYGYGDCKALSNYTAALLNVAGIKSHYALVKASLKEKPFFEDFPSQDFNHAILCVPLHKDTIWLECTSQTNPFGHVGRYIDNRKVLLITEDGGKIVTTKKYTRNQNARQQTSFIKINDKGDAQAKVITQYRGLRYDNIAPVFGRSYDAQKQFFYDRQAIPDFLIDKFSVSEHLEGTVPVAKNELNMSIRNFAKKSGNRFFITLNYNNRLEISLNQKERSNRIFIERGFVDTDTVIYDLPTGYELEFIPESQTCESQFGFYKTTVEYTDGKITYTRTLILDEGIYSKEAYEDFLVFLSNIRVRDNDKVVIVLNNN